MGKKFLVGVLLLSLILVSGCVQKEKECNTSPDCLSKTCFEVKCQNNACAYSPLTGCCGNEKCESAEAYENCPADCPSCDDTNECTEDSFDYHEQKCVNEPIIPCCGNGLCDKDAEAYGDCPADCPNCDDDTECTKDSFDYHAQKCVHSSIPGVVCCGNSICEVEETYEACPIDCPNCGDEYACTKDSFDYHNQECVNTLIIPCCGNEICDGGVETFSGCPADCPNCDDGDKLTGDSFNYETQECEYATYYFYEDFSEIDTWAPQPEKGPDPRWTIVDGMLTKVPDAEYAFANFGERSWTDYTLRLKVKFVEGNAYAYIRATFGQKGAYAVRISKAHLLLYRDIEGPGHTDLESKEYSFEANQLYEIKVEAKGSNIKVYVNDELQIDYTDTDDPLLSGGIGLELDQTAYFDDIIVEAP